VAYLIMSLDEGRALCEFALDRLLVLFVFSFVFLSALLHHALQIIFLLRHSNNDMGRERGEIRRRKGRKRVRKR
jgi:hypothetical protein